MIIYSSQTTKQGGYMKVQFNAQQPTFQCAVDPRFENAMRKCINSGANRLKNNYKLSSKIEEFNSLGYNDYTIQLEQKYHAIGTEYKMKAVSKDNEVILANRSSFRGILESFLKYPKREFNKRMQNG